MPSIKEIMAKRNMEAKPETEEKKKEFKTVMIHYSKLKPSKNNFYSTEEITELADLMLLSGEVKQNLLVRRINADEYEIIAGHKRTLAAECNVKRGYQAFEFLPCKIEFTNDVLTEFNLITTNSTVRDRSDYERMLEVQKLKEIIPLLINDQELKGRALRSVVAKEMKMSETKVANLDNINNNLSPKAMEKFREGGLGVTAANELAGLDHEVQEELMEQKGTDITVKEIKEKKAAALMKPEEYDAVIKIANREEVIEIIKYSDGQKARIDGLKNLFNNSCASNTNCAYRFDLEGLNIKVEAFSDRKISWNEFEKIVSNAVTVKDIESQLLANELYLAEKIRIIEGLKDWLTSGLYSREQEFVMTFVALVDQEEKIALLNEYMKANGGMQSCICRYIKRSKVEFCSGLGYVKIYSDMNDDAEAKEIDYVQLCDLVQEAIDREWIGVNTVSDSDTDNSQEIQLDPKDKTNHLSEIYECDGQIEIEDVTGTENYKLILKNDQERKDFIDTWKTWELWFEAPKIEAKYFRHTFDDGSYLVAVSYKHRSWRYYDKNEDEYSTAHFHLVKVGEHFYGEYATSISEIVEHLKQVVPRK